MHQIQLKPAMFQDRYVVITPAGPEHFDFDQLGRAIETAYFGTLVSDAKLIDAECGKIILDLKRGAFARREQAKHELLAA